MSAASTNLPTPDGPGSVSGAPQLPEEFTDTFTSRYIDTGELRLHAVTGGDGPPLLLIHGWPQTWCQWRLVMPTLARDFQVVAVDQRGIGLSDKPENGYDTGTLAGDLVALMDVLGHQRFALVGFDTGMPIAYALAADHPDRVERLVVGEAFLPGLSPAPPLVLPPQLNDRLWHIAFDQLETVNAIHTTIAQNQQRKERRLTVPVLAVGGAESSGAMLAALTAFLAPYQVGVLS